MLILFKMTDSESEEELIVYAEMDDSVDIERHRSVHVLGVDTKNPVIQMDDTFFLGKYEPSLGTYMFFEEDPDAQTSDPLFDKLPEKCLKYLYKTRKLIKFEQTYVVPKEGSDQEFQNCLQEKEENIEIPNFASIQVAIEKFKTEWEPINTQNSDSHSEQAAQSSETLEDITQSNQESLLSTGQERNSD